MDRFTDKRVYITGAGSGIGQATAIRIASEGANVYLVDMNTDGLAQTKARCEEFDGTVITERVDVSDEAAVNTSIEACATAFGGIDSVCHIAGILLLKRFDETTADEFHRITNVNLFGTFLVNRAAIPHLLESKGNIVNTSSTSALGGAGYGAVYGATKGGVSALTRGIAIEYGSRDVRCNSVVPGEVATNMTGGVTLPDDPDFSIMSRQGPLTAPATPDMLASVYAMLASDDGAYMNGSEVRADGGGLS